MWQSPRGSALGFVSSGTVISMGNGSILIIIGATLGMTALDIGISSGRDIYTNGQRGIYTWQMRIVYGDAWFSRFAAYSQH